MKPTQVSTRPYAFMGSVFKNSECETILRNIILLQQSRAKTGPNEWTPFSWEEYVLFCSHQVTTKEKDILDAFVNGGKPLVNSSANLSEGWLSFDGENYSFTDKMLEMLEGYKV